MAVGEGKYCPKCNKTLDVSNFYKRKSDGSYMDMCKKCITLHVDPFNPDSFLWILEDADVPYIPSEWNKLRDAAYAKDPKKMGSVFGKYLSKTRLGQYTKYTWADTEKFIEKEEEERKKFLEEHPEVALKDAALKQQYEAGLIGEAQYKTMMSAEMQADSLDEQAMRAMMGANPLEVPGVAPQVVADFIDPGAELTSEDKLFLATKWGPTYKPGEWVELEKFYNEMCESFDISDADTIGTLKLICKTNLKMNQAIDIGDVDGFNKLSRAYEAMRKSAKFTAAQKKEQEADFVDCVGTMVAYCERVGGEIPKYDISVDYDIIDKVIRDLKEYNRSLVYGDTALAQQIENYIKNREHAEEMKRAKEEAKAQGLDAPLVTDEDIIEYQNAILKDQATDKVIYQGEDGEKK